MIRARFKTSSEDFRPVNWPIKHPYWCSGHGEGYSIIVAYADDVEEIQRNWPEADDIDFTEEAAYKFTDRFQKPEWLKELTP